MEDSKCHTPENIPLVEQLSSVYKKYNHIWYLLQMEIQANKSKIEIKKV